MRLQDGARYKWTDAGQIGGDEQHGLGEIIGIAGAPERLDYRADCECRYGPPTASSLRTRNRSTSFIRGRRLQRLPAKNSVKEFRFPNSKSHCRWPTASPLSLPWPDYRKMMMMWPARRSPLMTR